MTTLRSSLAAPGMAAALALLLLPGCATLRWAHLAPAARPLPRAAKDAHATAGPATAAAAAPVPAPDPEDEHRRALRAAERLLEGGAQAEAESALVRLVGEDDHDGRALADLSQLYFATGRHADAIARLEPHTRPEAGLSNDARAVLLAGLALHYDAMGRGDRAAGTLAGVGDDALERVGSAITCVRLRGEHPDSADEVAARALRADRRSEANWNNFGVTRLRAGDVEGARKAFLEAIERDPARPGPYYNLAILEKFYLFHDAVAADWFRQFRERSHDDPDGLSNAFGAMAVQDTTRGGNGR